MNRKKVIQMAATRMSGVIVAATAVFLAASAANAMMVTAGRVTPPSGGWVRCTVVNLPMKPLEFRLELRGAHGQIVTNFISFEWTNDYTIVASAPAESYAETATSCRVYVRGGRRRDVAVMLESFDADGGVVDRVQRGPGSRGF
jgi:hypothetical protein